MKKLGIGIAGLTLVVLATGFTFGEWIEYGTVIRNDVRQAIGESIPTDVELKRLQGLVASLDTKVRDQKRIVAKAQIQLEDSEQLLAQSQAKCLKIKQEMLAVRSLAGSETFVSTCGTRLSTEQRTRLATLLSTYKTHAATLAAREKAVKAQREAVCKLTSRFNDWSLQRETLAQRVESLQARHTATKIAAVDATGIRNDDLNRALDLAQKIESRIRVEERLGQDFAGGDFELAADNGPENSVEDEVDAILAQ